MEPLGPPAVYRACRGRGHRHSAEGRVGRPGHATGRAGAARAVVHSGPHPRQSAALRAGLRPRARRGRRGPGRRRVEHRRGLDGAERRAGRRRRQHHRRTGGDGHPHPSRPLRAGRPGPRGLRRVDRAAPGRRRACSRPATATPTSWWPACPASCPTRACPTTSSPTWPSASMAVKSMVTMAVPDVLFEDGKAIDLPGWSLRTIWTPGHSPGHVCFYSDDRQLLHLGRPRPAPDHPQHLGPRPAGGQPAGRLSSTSLAKLRGPRTDEVLPGPRVPVRRPRRPAARRSWPTTPTASTRSSR